MSVYAHYILLIMATSCQLDCNWVRDSKRYSSQYTAIVSGGLGDSYGGGGGIDNILTVLQVSFTHFLGLGNLFTFHKTMIIKKVL